MGLNNNLGKLTEILTVSGSSIGLGTVSPSQKLEVSGSIKAHSLVTGLTSYDTNGLTIRNAANTSNVWSINKGAGDGSENWQFYNFGRNSIDFSLNNSTGYVGIGTINPLSMLHSKSSGYPTLTLEGGINNGAGIRFFGDTTQFAEIFGEYQSSGNRQLFFRTRNSNTISTAMTILGNGNVGIGSTNPLYRLQVQKTSISVPAIMIGGAYYGGPRLQVYGLDDNPNAWMGLGADMSSGIYEHSVYFPNYGGNGRLSFGSYNGTTYSEKMCINPSGYVGIGTSNPDYHLKVSTASIYTAGFSSSGGETIVQVNNVATNGRNWFIISGGTSGSYSGGKFGIYNATNTLEAFTISPAGHVGIGTINPLSSLGRTLTVEGTGIFQTTTGGGNYNENLRLNRAGNGYASIIIGGAYNSTTGYSTGQWALAATPSTMGYRFDFDYSGATVATIGTSGGYTQVSDRNKKKDFEELNIGLNAILGLKPTLYRMKEDSEDEEKQLGFIAQEVKDFIPQAYSETIDGFIGLQDRPIVAALVKALQEQQELIEQLTSRITNLENQ